MLLNFATASGELAASKQKYDILQYSYQNSIYENDNDVGKKELMDDISEWNQNLARKKENSKSIWFGIFYPDIYDELEFIDVFEPLNSD